MKSTAAPRPLPFLSNPAFSPTPPFLEKFFYPCLNFQIRASQPPPPLWKWGGGEGGGRNTEWHTLDSQWDYSNTHDIKADSKHFPKGSPCIATKTRNE